MRRRDILVVLAIVALTAACEPVVETVVPVGEARIDCQGVPPQACRDALTMARDNARAPLVELVVRCTVLPCTLQQGQTEARALYADGTQETFGSNWSGAVPAPPAPAVAPDPIDLAVLPECLGVPEALCLEMATDAVSGLPADGPDVRSVTVRCTAVCTSTRAEGETRIVFADGTSTETIWGFESGG